MSRIYTGDDSNAFGQDFLKIEIENLTMYEISKAIFRCGEIIKEIENPEFPLKIDLTSKESELLKSMNTCYLAVFDEYGRKQTCEGSITFPAKKGVV